MASLQQAKSTVIRARLLLATGALSAVLGSPSCNSMNAPTAAAAASDAALFMMITQTQPFGSYSLFPNAEAVTTGTLNGSSAHRPQVRVSLNAIALSALQNGRLLAGTRFPDGSIVFKEIRTGGTATLYAVMVKDRSNARAGNGWLWAEFNPSGSVAYSTGNRGSACTACHSLEQGPANDFVRTFERQRP